MRRWGLLRSEHPVRRGRHPPNCNGRLAAEKSPSHARSFVSGAGQNDAAATTRPHGNSELLIRDRVAPARPFQLPADGDAVLLDEAKELLLRAKAGNDAVKAALEAAGLKVENGPAGEPCSRRHRVCGRGRRRPRRLRHLRLWRRAAARHFRRIGGGWLGPLRTGRGADGGTRREAVVADRGRERHSGKRAFPTTLVGSLSAPMRNPRMGRQVLDFDP